MDTKPIIKPLSRSKLTEMKKKILTYILNLTYPSFYSEYFSTLILNYQFYTTIICQFLAIFDKITGSSVAKCMFQLCIKDTDYELTSPFYVRNNVFLVLFKYSWIILFTSTKVHRFYSAVMKPFARTVVNNKIIDFNHFSSSNKFQLMIIFDSTHKRRPL